MTYLELVNGVLARLRETLAPTVMVNEDPVVNVVKSLVNDAKRHVEMAYSWNATREFWEIETVQGQPSYILDNTSGGCRISKVSIDGTHIHQWDLKTLMHGRQQEGHPYRYAFDGSDDEGNISLRLDPFPNKEYALQVLGHRVLPDLSQDHEPLSIPSQPVLYYALALAARERGEVGGQTAQELFGMAQQYISDAIALDANLSPTEHTWAVV